MNEPWITSLFWSRKENPKIPTAAGFFSGDVAVVLEEDTASVIFVNVVGFLPIKVKQVLDTGTDATNILALY